MPKVSFIMSAYNASMFIEDTIKSIINQTYTDFEAIIIDDASTDNTYEILSNIRDERFKVIQNNKNCGLTINLNKAIQLASGKYIARIDSDDICTRDRLLIQVNYMESHPEIDILGSNAYLIDEKNNIVGITDETLDESLIKAKVQIMNPFIHPTIIGKSEIFKKYMYNNSFRTCQDYELWVRLQHSCIYKNISNPTIFYRLNKNGATRSAKNNIGKRIELLTPIVKDSLQQNNNDLSNDEIRILLSMIFQVKNNCDYNSVFEIYRKIRNKDMDKAASFTLFRYFGIHLIKLSGIALFANGLHKAGKYYYRVLLIRSFNNKVKSELIDAIG